MDPQIIAAIIAGIFLLLSTSASALTAYITKRSSDLLKAQGDDLSKKFDETAKIIFVEGEKDTFDALTRLTLNETMKVHVTSVVHRY